MIRLDRFIHSIVVIVVVVSASVTLTEVKATESGEVFATVGDKVIYAEEYNSTLQQTIRKRFYHGQPPAELVAEVRREVADQMVERILLLQEAGRRELTPNRDLVEQQLKQYLANKKIDSNVNKKVLHEWLQEQDLLRQLEVTVKDVPQPSDTQVEKFYTDYPKKFTEPEQVRLSVILLSVAASSPSSVWRAAREEATRIKQNLARGTDFGELARLHSADASATAGGDMGYVHKGMLSEPVEQVVSQLEIGQTSDPIMVLEGIALFRLADKRPPKLRTLSEVRKRAQELTLQNLSERSWQDLINRLRSETDISIEQKYLNQQA